MKITRLHHAQITVPPGAEDAARAFYVTLLGFSEIEKPASLVGRGGLWLEASDGTPLHVGTEDGVERAATRAHLAWEVAELSAWRAMLTHHGFAPIDGVPIPGCERFEFRDPFGNRVEFIERVMGDAERGSPG